MVVKKSPAPGAPETPGKPQTAQERLARMMKDGSAIAKLREKYDTVVQPASQVVSIVPRIITGAFPFDLAMGGGVPGGVIHHWFGPKYAGKTVTACLTAAAVQRLCTNCYQSFSETCCPAPRQGLAAFIDVEGALDLAWAKRLGVDTETLAYSKPGSGEEAADTMDIYLTGGEVDIVVLDSIAALAPRAEQNKAADEAVVGEQARIVHRMMRKSVSALNAAGNMNGGKGRRPTIIFLNQVRYKVGVMFGNPETTAGGTGPAYTASTEVRFRSPKHQKVTADTKTPEGSSALIDSPVFVEVNFTIEKNKTFAAKGIEGDFRVMQRDTLDKRLGEVYDEHHLVARAIDAGLIEGAGNSWTCLGKQFRGKGVIEQELVKDKKLKSDLRDAVIKVLTSIVGG